LPIVGDWDGDGQDTVGLYSPASSIFFLRNDHAAGLADLVFAYGAPGAGWLPIVGDWNGDGDDTVALYNGATGNFFLRNAHAPGPADLRYAYGPVGAGWLPLAGDWNHDGIDTVGMFAPNTATFYLRNEHAGGRADVRFDYGGARLGWLPLVGDWDGQSSAATNSTEPSNPVVAIAGPSRPVADEMDDEGSVATISTAGDPPSDKSSTWDEVWAEWE
jgi:hypothetical protein